MRYLSDVSMAKEIDRLSINDIGIPSVVLMERAAMAVSAAICNNTCVGDKVLVLCGNGNNGADGIAVARMLKEMGYGVDVLLLCGEEGTQEFNIQLNIARKLGVSFINETFCAYKVVVDAIFGIGLSRNIEGRIKDTILEINNNENRNFMKVFAVDVPSGISADGVKVSDTVLRADYTITFGTNKLGLVIGQNVASVGEIIVADIGFPKVVMDYVCEEYFYYEENELKHIVPRRRTDSNKGSYGKVLAVCGSVNMSGAAYLCGKSAYKSGAGMVKIISHSDNRNIIQTSLPEGLFDSYNTKMNCYGLDNGQLDDSTNSGDFLELYGDIDEQALMTGIDFADAIVIGPGLGYNYMSTNVFEYVVNNSNCNIIVDADGINILSLLLDTDEDRARNLLESLRGRCIITPHIVEMSRLTGNDKSFVKENQIIIAKEFAKEYGIITVLKDSRSVVSDGDKVYVNVAGNNGMATAGSGDVLAGIIASFVAQGKGLFEGACAGCFAHGIAGDYYAAKHNRHSLIASDLIDSLENIL